SDRASPTARSPRAPPPRRCPSGARGPAGCCRALRRPGRRSGRARRRARTGSVGSSAMHPEALLDGLDDAQRLAVTSTALPLVILAPAGSGKTRVLTRRIAYRVATGDNDARHVLALTFTRKAAGELTDRLVRLGLRREATAG